MKKKVIEVVLVGTLERTEHTVAVMVRRAETKEPTEKEMRAISQAVTTMYDDGVLVICLGPNEHIETLDETEMNQRGWVRGTVSKDRRTQIRRKH